VYVYEGSDAKQTALEWIVENNVGHSQMAMLVDAIEAHLSKPSGKDYAECASEYAPCACTHREGTRPHEGATHFESLRAQVAAAHGQITVLASKLSSSAQAIADSVLVPRAAMVYENQRRSLSNSLARCMAEQPHQLEKHREHVLGLTRPSKMNGFDVCPRYWAVSHIGDYTPVFDDTAEALRKGLANMGMDVIRTSVADCFNADPGQQQRGGIRCFYGRQHIVLGVLSHGWTLSDGDAGGNNAALLPPGSLLLQLEQLESVRLQRAVAARPLVGELLKGHILLDYSYANLMQLRKAGLVCSFMLPLGSIPDNDQTSESDVASSSVDGDGGGGGGGGGSDNGDDGDGACEHEAGQMDAVLLSMPIDRRTKIIQALRRPRNLHGQSETAASVAVDARRFEAVWGIERKRLLQCAKVGLNIHQWPARVAEVPRLLHYLDLGVAAVSEDGIDYMLESEFDEAIFFASEGEEFLSAVRAAVSTPQIRRRMRRKGRAIQRLRDQSLLLAQTISVLFPACSPTG
jgi:hypothetical protein